MSYREGAAEMQGSLTELRRALHREPEVGLHLPRTQERVLAALEGVPLEITLGRALTSVTGVLRGGRPGPVVLLRGDMDALPIRERTGLDFASRNEAMHACGHDLHTAMLVGAARLMAADREPGPGTVIFMFQPGEEGYAGAKIMIDEGILEAAGEPVDAAYGLHVASSWVPRDVFASRPGTTMASSDNLRVTVRGSGGHGSTPHHAKDPIPAACEMVTALQTFVTRTFDVFDPVVITVGTFSAGTKENVIPDEAYFAATIRAFSPEARARVKDGSVAVVRGLAAAYGLDVSAEYADMYPVTVNDAAEHEFAVDVVTDLFGDDRRMFMANPLAASEDFSFVLQRVPGAFLMLGAGPLGLDRDRVAPNHSPLAVFDDAVIADGAALLAELAARRLGGRSRV